MSMPFSRNVVIPIWFAIFPLAAFFVPSSNVGFSLFLLLTGLAVPTVVYLLWQDPPLRPLGIGPPRLDTSGQEGVGKG